MKYLILLLGLSMHQLAGAGTVFVPLVIPAKASHDTPARTSTITEDGFVQISQGFIRVGAEIRLCQPTSAGEVSVRDGHCVVSQNGKVSPQPDLSLQEYLNAIFGQGSVALTRVDLRGSGSAAELMVYYKRLSADAFGSTEVAESIAALRAKYPKSDQQITDFIIALGYPPRAADIAALRAELTKSFIEQRAANARDRRQQKIDALVARPFSELTFDEQCSLVLMLLLNNPTLLALGILAMVFGAAYASVLFENRKVRTGRSEITNPGRSTDIVGKPVASTDKKELRL